MAVLAAAGLTGRFDWPRLGDAMVVPGAIVTVLAALGARDCLGNRAIRWGWVAVAALISAAGVWAGVPETGPALLAAGGLVGLVATAALTGAYWAPGAGVGVAAVLGWAALSGASGRPWAAAGGVLCTGVAPWLAFRRRILTPSRNWSQPLSPWLLGGHMALVLLAARWIGVEARAGWGRVVIVAFAGIVVATATRRQA